MRAPGLWSRSDRALSESRRVIWSSLCGGQDADTACFVLLAGPLCVSPRRYLRRLGGCSTVPAGCRWLTAEGCTISWGSPALPNSRLSRKSPLLKSRLERLPKSLRWSDARSSLVLVQRFWEAFEAGRSEEHT